MGLGLSLFKQSAELCGGQLRLSSTPGVGTLVRATFEYIHLDRPVAGDIAGTLVMTMASAPQISFFYTHVTDEGRYAVSSEEVAEALEGVSLNNPAVMRAVEEMIRENLREIKAEMGRPLMVMPIDHRSF